MDPIPRPPRAKPPAEALFTVSTISKDETGGAASNELRILASNTRPVINPWVPSTGPPPAPSSPPFHSDSKGMGPFGFEPNSQLHQRAKIAQSENNSLTVFPEAETSGSNTNMWRQTLHSQRVDVPSTVDLTDVATTPDVVNEEVLANNVTLAGKPNLAIALGSVADEYLNIDILDDHQTTSKYVAFLLDVIHNLQSRLEFTKKEHTVSLPKISKGAEPVLEQTPRFEVLHRVFCGTTHHDHDAMVYEDVPELTKEATGILSGEEILRGEKEIYNVEAYLTKQTNIHFVIFKEYRCGHGVSWFEKKNRAADSMLRGVFDLKKTSISPRQERLKVVSPLLQKALHTVAECKLDNITFDDPCNDSEEMQAPYNFLFHHRRKLQQLVKDNPARYAPLKLLLDYLDINYEQEYLEAEALFARGLVSENHLEKLFKPNMIVMTEDKGIKNAYILDQWPVRKSNQLILSGWQWNYTGRSLEREEWYSKIDLTFLAEKDIHRLTICPLEFVQYDTVQKLKERGHKFWTTKRQHLVSYDGWDRSHSYFYVKERFMVDMTTYVKMHSRHMTPKPGAISEFDNMPESIGQDEDLNDMQLLLLPSVTHGYSLREKKWVSIHIDQMSEVVWNKKAFKRLVLDGKTKDLIRALIDVRMSDSKKLDDLVVGKGNGLIMLLHGSPGTGKSLTAESVAEFAEKPLYRVTCGDIGTNPKEAEKYLETVLYLGKIWDCVLLLDEADVFLEERSVSDLQRNSLVSIFLRVLEYYEGIMILTSNRVGTFDEAFQSRIRVALRYEPLTSNSRKAIWRNFFEMIEEDDEEIKINIRGLEDRLDDLAGYRINGRQIRNVLLTARQLALYQKESLEWEHLSQVLKLSDNFNKYLKDIKGVSDEDWAKSQSLR